MVATGFVAALVLYRYGDALLSNRGSQQPGAVISGLQNMAAGSSDAFSFSFRDQPQALPDIHFTDGEGRSLSLQYFQSRPVLLNIWATWCVPCREEMPALDRLEAAFGASQLLVLPLSIDRQGLPVVRKFYEELGLTSLGMYVDQSNSVSSELHVVGLPTTLIIDRDSREIGRKVGPAEWDSPEIVALIRTHLGLSTSERKTGP